MAIRNSKGQLNGYYGRQKSQNNPDRPISTLEQIASNEVVIIRTPEGEKLDKPKKMLKYEWLIAVRESMLMYGYFYNPKGDKVKPDNYATKIHYNDIIETANNLDSLDYKDLIYLANYKREGLLEHPQLTLIKKHFRNCKSLCAIMDVYAWDFRMRGWQREAIDSKEFIVALTGGRYRGGSHVLIPKMILTAMTSGKPITVTIGRKDKASNRTSTFVSALALLTIPEFAMMVSRINRSTMTIEFINGSKVIFVGYYTEQQRAGTKGVGSSDNLGGGIHASAIEELTDGVTEDDFNTIQTNTRASPDSQVICAMNPGPPNHWFKINIIDAEQIGTTPQGGKIVRFTDTKNAVIYSKTAKDNEWGMQNNPDYWEQLLAIKSPTLRRRYAYGEWTAAEGAVYSEFDPNRHIVNDPTFNILEKMKYKEGDIVIGGDWGARDATAIIWMYFERITIELPTGSTIKTWRVFVYRQFYMYNCNREHVARFVASFPDSKMAKMFVGGHEGISELDSLKKLGVKTTHNKDKRLMGEYDKATIAEFANEAMSDDRFHILKNCLVDNNTVDPLLKLSDYQEPKPSQPQCLEDELPMATWEIKKKDGVEIHTGKIKDGNDHGGDAMLNALQHIQNWVDGNNIANLRKMIMGINGR